MAERLIRWLAYTVVFALFPLGTSCVLRKMREVYTRNWLVSSSEVLFFCLMICATACGDLYEAKSARRSTRALAILYSAFQLGLALSAMFYGTLVYDTLQGGGSARFQENLFDFAWPFAGVAAVAGTLTQILIARAEGIP